MTGRTREVSQHWHGGHNQRRSREKAEQSHLWAGRLLQPAWPWWGHGRAMAGQGCHGEEEGEEEGDVLQGARQGMAVGDGRGADGEGQDVLPALQSCLWLERR